MISTAIINFGATTITLLNNPNEDTVNEWVERENIALVLDAKDKRTFRSGRWQRDYKQQMTIVAILYPLAEKTSTFFPIVNTALLL